MQATEAAGISAVWTIVLFYLLPLCALLPGYFLRWRQLIKGGPKLHIACMFAGVFHALYAGAFLFTTVMNAMLLYYLTPIWSTFPARAALGEVMTRDPWTTIALGLLRMQVLLGGGFILAWPQNICDWMGLAAGIL